MCIGFYGKRFILTILCRYKLTCFHIGIRKMICFRLPWILAHLLTADIVQKSWRDSTSRDILLEQYEWKSRSNMHFSSRLASKVFQNELTNSIPSISYIDFWLRHIRRNVLQLVEKQDAKCERESCLHLRLKKLRRLWFFAKISFKALF